MRRLQIPAIRRAPQQRPTPVPGPGAERAVAGQGRPADRHNPKYVGRQVWARAVAGRPVPVEQWITSAPKVHEPLVDERTFHRAQPSTAAPGETGLDAPASVA